MSKHNDKNVSMSLSALFRLSTCILIKKVVYGLIGIYVVDSILGCPRSFLNSQNFLWINSSPSRANVTTSPVPELTSFLSEPDLPLPSQVHQTITIPIRQQKLRNVLLSPLQARMDSSHQTKQRLSRSSICSSYREGLFER